jgi:phosphonate transport system substrate-binding protein
MFAVVIAFALVAAACGDDEGGGTTTTGAPGTTAAPTTTTEGDMDPREGWPDSLIFGFVPSRESETLQDNVEVLAGILADALDMDVTGVVTSDYTALGVALGTGEAQIGAFAPANYVLASRIYPNIELLAQSVRFGSATYHAQYFTNDPSVCGEGVSVIAGGSMAYGTETSTSGYIFPVLELRSLGLEQDVDYTSCYSGSHDNSVLFVYDSSPCGTGTANFGVSFDDARRNVRETNPDVGEKVIVINISAPISNDVISVDAGLPASLKDAIYNAIAAVFETEEGLALMDEIYSWTDVIRADERTQASFVLIEAAIDELGFGS